ncbi:MAG: hypothetical protein AAF378_22160 [Cyanobacteria bacterium P01_A01_bin.84]
MSGFGSNVVRKSKKSNSKKGKSNRNMKAVAKFKAGEEFAMIEAAMQYQLEETLNSGSYY